MAWTAENWLTHSLHSHLMRYLYQTTVTVTHTVLTPSGDSKPVVPSFVLTLYSQKADVGALKIVERDGEQVEQQRKLASVLLTTHALIFHQPTPHYPPPRLVTFVPSYSYGLRDIRRAGIVWKNGENSEAIWVVGSIPRCGPAQLTPKTTSHCRLRNCDPAPGMFDAQILHHVGPHRLSRPFVVAKRSRMPRAPVQLMPSPWAMRSGNTHTQASKIYSPCSPMLSNRSF